MALKTPDLRYPNLKLWREDRRWSQRHAAKFLGITCAMYSRLERGYGFSWAKKAKVIHEQTGVPLEVLAGLDSGR